ncbi:MAG: DUF971 domain-containing protein [Kangiellaceae bacterium]|jgi:DUF971 family protein|nr:DUF971 domain-containing protein [Kangiellaceae bacterium]
MNQTPPSAINFHKQSQVLDVTYSDTTYSMPAEYLRVYSPSAEVRGHGNDEIKLVPGKQDVKIIDIKPVGYYAVQLTFDDGHDSGLYTWSMLEQLGKEQEANWHSYLQRLAAAGESRAPKPLYKKAD